MKSLTFKWLSGAIALPLFITTLNPATPAEAEQIERSSMVTELNLTIPVEATITDNNSTRQSNLQPATKRNSQIATINLAISPNKQQTTNTRSQSRATVRIATTNNSPSERSPKVKSGSRIKILTLARVSSIDVSIPKNIRQSKSNLKHNPRAISHSSSTGNYLRLIRSSNKGTNDLGNPIYTLETYIDGELDRTFNAVSGTANSQKADRNLGNNHAPLPDGSYDVNNWIAPGTVAEVDRTFIGIIPKFRTNRHDLGIHLDPSFNKRNGYDGTSGCIGLTTAEDRDAINDFVVKYHPRNLFVKILASEE